MQEDIFDLSDLTDIPQEIKKDLKMSLKNRFEINILQIFRMANRPLNIDEVTIAYYRLFNKIKNRHIIMTKLYNMSRSKRALIEIIPKRKGVYKLINKIESKPVIKSKPIDSKFNWMGE